MTLKDQSFEKFLDFLKTVHGVDLKIYKYPTLMRRIGKRMQTVNVPDYEAYQDYLDFHPNEFSELFTSKKKDEEIRIWPAGCASGEEAYT